MSAGWVAGAVRGRLLDRRRVGVAGARAVAAADGPAEAVAIVARSAYGRDVREDMPIPTARRAVGAACLWHLRVLAGWLPPRAGDVVRVWAARFELVNIGDKLGEREAGWRPYELGALAVAWPRIEGASSSDAVRGALAASPWGDPGSTDWPVVELVLAARWASWLAGADAGMSAWAAGSAALVAARRLVAGDGVPGALRSDLDRLLGPGWDTAGDLSGLSARLPQEAAWVLDEVEEAADLWRAEGRWWRRVDRDAADTLRRARPGPPAVAAAAARLMADAWWTQAALEASAWGSTGVEAFDAVA